MGEVRGITSIDIKNRQTDGLIHKLPLLKLAFVVSLKPELKTGSKNIIGHKLCKWRTMKSPKDR